MQTSAAPRAGTGRRPHAPRQRLRLHRHSAARRRQAADPDRPPPPDHDDTTAAPAAPAGAHAATPASASARRPASVSTARTRIPVRPGMGVPSARFHGIQRPRRARSYLPEGGY